MTALGTTTSRARSGTLWRAVALDFAEGGSPAAGSNRSSSSGPEVGSDGDAEPQEPQHRSSLSASASSSSEESFPEMFRRSVLRPARSRLRLSESFEELGETRQAAAQPGRCSRDLEPSDAGPLHQQDPYEFPGSGGQRRHVAWAPSQVIVVSDDDSSSSCESAGEQFIITLESDSDQENCGMRKAFATPPSRSLPARRLLRESNATHAEAAWLSPSPGKPAGPAEPVLEDLLVTPARPVTALRPPRPRAKGRWTPSSVPALPRALPRVPGPLPATPKTAPRARLLPATPAKSRLGATPLTVAAFRRQRSQLARTACER